MNKLLHTKQYTLYTIIVKPVTIYKMQFLKHIRIDL